MLIKKKKKIITHNTCYKRVWYLIINLINNFNLIAFRLNTHYTGFWDWMVRKISYTTVKTNRGRVVDKTIVLLRKMKEIIGNVKIKKKKNFKIN